MQDAPDDMVGPEREVPRDRCVFDHALFSKLGAISFRRSDTDGTPMMMLPFGEREAGVPLRSIQVEIGIADASRDGQMFGLIAESLDYVTSLCIGDALPAEVVDGGASWEPTAAHRLAAATRLRLQLLAWLDPDVAYDVSKSFDVNQRLESDLEIRAKVQSAFCEAAVVLELATVEKVVALVERLGEEYAYVEALRERLLTPVQNLTSRLAQLGRGPTCSGMQRRETITQVQRLIELAHSQFRSRFDEVGAQTAEVIATLRNADSQIAYIRSNRDGLYRSFRAWTPILETWADIDAGGDSSVWRATTDLYQFLARRYLPSSEWPNFNSLRRGNGSGKQERMMEW